MEVAGHPRVAVGAHGDGRRLHAAATALQRALHGLPGRRLSHAGAAGVSDAASERDVAAAWS